MSRVTACQNAECAAVSVRKLVDDDGEQASIFRSRKCRKKREEDDVNMEEFASQNNDILDEESEEEDLNTDNVVDDTQGFNNESDSSVQDMQADDADSEVNGCNADNEDEHNQHGPNRQYIEAFREFCNTHEKKFLPSLTNPEMTAVKLMDVLKRKKAPLNAYQELLEWHLG